MSKYTEEFPTFVLDVAVPAEWTDTSWHNDVSPSFQTPNGLRVWVDFAVATDREFGEGERFHVDRLETEVGGHNAENFFNSDDWSAVLAFVSSYKEPMNKRDALLTYVARVHLNLETLEARNSDRLDFHDDVGVWQIKAALVAAFEAGQQQATP